LRRGIIRKEGEEADLFVFTRDLKYRVPGLYGYSNYVWIKFAERLTCPYLVISASSRPAYFKPGKNWRKEREREKEGEREMG
jgi:hypothetical protein